MSNVQDPQRAQATWTEANRKALMKSVRVVIDDQRAKRDSRAVAAPSLPDLQEARTRLNGIDGLELLLFLRANPGFFTSRLFE